MARSITTVVQSFVALCAIQAAWHGVHAVNASPQLHVWAAGRDGRCASFKGLQGWLCLQAHVQGPGTGSCSCAALRCKGAYEQRSCQVVSAGEGQSSICELLNSQYCKGCSECYVSASKCMYCHKRSADHKSSLTGCVSRLLTRRAQILTLAQSSNMCTMVPAPCLSEEDKLICSTASFHSSAVVDRYSVITFGINSGKKCTAYRQGAEQCRRSCYRSYTHS